MNQETIKAYIEAAENALNDSPETATAAALIAIAQMKFIDFNRGK